ncbi:MAG TPA: hypothetical protein VNI84_10080 [Pyrinomonadaceae bacterium]|nr:hypothetical protein [Pyrinomonadaceae bacterium]
MNRKTHWDTVYQTKLDREVSWFSEHLDNSLRMILNTKAGKEAAIIDVGGGSSTLADDLLEFIKEKLCVCEIRNPAGACCLGEINITVKRLAAKPCVKI